MSLRLPQPVPPVPDDTARIARAAPIAMKK